MCTKLHDGMWKLRKLFSERENSTSKTGSFNHVINLRN